jgi:hypothetical protein
MPRVVLLRKLTLFFARLTAHCEWQRSEAPFRDLASARQAPSVRARLESDERFADPAQGLCSHLEQRTLNVALDVGVRLVDVIADVIALVDSLSADPILDVVLQLTTAFDQDLPQVCNSSRGLHDE